MARAEAALPDQLPARSLQWLEQQVPRRLQLQLRWVARPPEHLPGLRSMPDEAEPSSWTEPLGMRCRLWPAVQIPLPAESWLEPGLAEAKVSPVQRLRVGPLIQRAAWNWEQPLNLTRQRVPWSEGWLRQVVSLVMRTSAAAMPWSALLSPGVSEPSLHLVRTG